MPSSTPIVRTRLPRVLRPRRCIDGRIRRAIRRLARSLPTSSISTESSCASSPTALKAVTSATRLRALLIHAIPRRRAARAAEAALLLHAALLLLLVLLLLEGELFLRGVSWSLLIAAWVRVRHTCVSARSAGTAGAPLTHHGLHLHWIHAAAAHHVLRVRGPCVAVHPAAIHHCHLLHLHGIHPAHGAHAATHAALLLGEVLLHLLEVLLHALPVLGHHGRRHIAGGALGLSVGRVVEAAVVAALVVVIELVAAEFLVATIIVAHVASRLSTLDFDGLAEDLERLAERGIDSSIAVEGDETETTWAARLLVHHQGCINDTAELLEELGEVLLGCLLADTANEYLACALLLFTGNSALWVDLENC